MQKERYTLVAEFAVQGDLAYLSHQETLTLFQRALIRAAVPLVYSSGFNPHPHLSIPFPRSVGTRSAGDRLSATVDYETPPSCEALSGRIGRHLPSGCTLSGLRCIPGKQTYLPRSVRYHFALKAPVDAARQAHRQACRGRMQDGGPIEIQRYWAKKKRYKQFDISPYLQSLTIQDDGIDAVCSVSPAGTVRVDELMQWLTIDITDLREPVARADIEWEQN
jgi:radical SAM-linked protein